MGIARPLYNCYRRALTHGIVDGHVQVRDRGCGVLDGFFSSEFVIEIETGGVWTWASWPWKVTKEVAVRVWHPLFCIGSLVVEEPFLGLMLKRCQVFCSLALVTELPWLFIISIET